MPRTILRVVPSRRALCIINVTSVLEAPGKNFELSCLRNATAEFNSRDGFTLSSERDTDTRPNIHCKQFIETFDKDERQVALCNQEKENVHKHRLSLASLRPNVNEFIGKQFSTDIRRVPKDRKCTRRRHVSRF